MIVSFYDTKRYDRESFESTPDRGELSLRFHEARLDAAVAATAEGSTAVCAFVQDHLDRPCLERLAHHGVQMVALRCAGFNNLDQEAAAGLGIAVTRVPAYSPHAVAEHTVGLLLTLNRKIHRAFNRVREQNFSLAGLVGFDIAGKTVGIVGTGRIGRLVAQIFRGFDTRVVAFDPFPDAGWAASHAIEYVGIEELLGVADIISLHTPLMPETHHLINERTLALVKPGAYIVNTSRGKLIDSAAVIEALKAGRLGGVALDVYEEEEGVFFEDLSGEALQDDLLARLLTFPNVLITSHQAFLTREALAEIARVTVANLRAFEQSTPFLDGTTLVSRPR